MRAKTPSRRKLLCACLFCSLALWAQAPATSTPKPADTPPKTAIEGRVLNAATDEPVRKATLTLMHDRQIGRAHV